MSNSRHCFTSYTACDITIFVRKGTIKAVGYGNARIATFTASKGPRVCTFTAVIHVPELVANLLSTQALVQKGCFYRNNLQVPFIETPQSNCVPMADVYDHNGLPHLTKNRHQPQPLHQALVTITAPARNNRGVASTPRSYQRTQDHYHG
ncbi:hypothetical protein TI39_contig620g00001 [Zymoseptoria brevis]|uniref:Retrovirus-related Pol polyprotein from transposon TNT 1-94-like beta-barrel domain-containing protein n=1 Tax=Zymoseptoria brevis TaxID=1047168 RepID=A0A0F4GK00_9PEZI|nr:hypothetical protein TI39_contig620g00001 [Zymoseptoria brevis]